MIPKGEVTLVAEGSINAGIKEEDVTKAAEVKIDTTVSENIIKTKTKLNRSLMPKTGADPEIKTPQSWTGSLSNGLKMWGIKQSELPLIQYSLVIDGGHLRDNIEKSGLANMVATMMNEGTKNKTPEELEDAIGLLGASIRVSASNEDISIDVSTLSRNFEKTMALVEEILIEPRWDEERFSLASSRVLNTIKRNEASPDYLSSSTLNKLMFGNSIIATDVNGTVGSVPTITVSDCRDFYNKCLSPSVSRFLIAGDVEKQRVESALASLKMGSKGCEAC